MTDIRGTNNMNDIFKTLQYQGRILEQLGVNRFST